MAGPACHLEPVTSPLELSFPTRARALDQIRFSWGCSLICRLPGPLPTFLIPEFEICWLWRPMRCSPARRRTRKLGGAAALEAKGCSRGPSPARHLECRNHHHPRRGPHRLAGLEAWAVVRAGGGQIRTFRPGSWLRLSFQDGLGCWDSWHLFWG